MSVRIGPCGECPPIPVGQGIDGCALVEQEVATNTATVDSVDTNLFTLDMNLGSFDAGVYMLKYCRGAWKDSGSDWLVDEQSHSLYDKSFEVEHSGGSISDFTGQPASIYYSTLEEVEDAYACFKCTFDHTSTNDIILRFIDDYELSNTDSDPKLKFGLYKINLAIRVNSICAVWNTVNSSCNIVINVSNLTQHSWTGVTFHLGSRTTTFDINALQTKNVTFDPVLESDCILDDQDIYFSHSLSDDTPVVTYDIRPIFKAFLLPSDVVQCYSTCSNQLCQLFVRIQNIGNWTSDYRVTWTNDGGVLFINNDVCTTSSSRVDTGSGNCNAGSTATEVLRLQKSSATGKGLVTFTGTVTDNHGTTLTSVSFQYSFGTL